MPISTEQFNTTMSSQDLLSNTMETLVRISKHMMKESNVPIIDVYVTKKVGCYHRRSGNHHHIVLGAPTFNPKNKFRFRTYIISGGDLMQVKASSIPWPIHVMSVTIEETAHYLQSLTPGGRTTGSVHNQTFFEKFKYLWDKHSDEILPLIEQALKVDNINY